MNDRAERLQRAKLAAYHVMYGEPTEKVIAKGGYPNLDACVAAVIAAYGDEPAVDTSRGSFGMRWVHGKGYVND